MRILEIFDNLRTKVPGVNKVLSSLFGVSLLMDADMVFSPILIRHGAIVPHTWGIGTHIVIAVIEVSLMVGATVLWFSMFYFCLCTGHGVLRRVLWALAFFFGIWWTAQFYYFFLYRNSLNRNPPLTTGGSCPSSSRTGIDVR